MGLAGANIAKENQVSFLFDKTATLQVFRVSAGRETNVIENKVIKSFEGVEPGLLKIPDSPRLLPVIYLHLQKAMNRNLQIFTGNLVYVFHQILTKPELAAAHSYFFPEVHCDSLVTSIRS